MKTRLLIICLLAVLMANSCDIYHPASTNIPLITHKGELQVEGGAVLMPEDIPPVRVDVSYGLFNGFAVEAAIDQYRGQSQVMAGHFHPVGDHFVWEVYVGRGYGEGSLNNHEDTKRDGWYTTYFLQADCGWRELTKRLHMDIALSLKGGVVDSRVHYYSPVLDEDGDHWEWQGSPTQYGTNLLLQPGVEIRFGGWEQLKVNVKGSYCFISRNAGYRIPYFPFDFGIGVSLHF